MSAIVSSLTVVRRARAQPASAVVVRGLERWIFLPVSEPYREGIPHFEVKP